MHHISIKQQYIRMISRLYLDIFDRMHLLFTQVHLLFDSLAEGQYAKYIVIHIRTVSLYDNSLLCLET